MGGFAFQVACLRLVALEPLFYYESTDGPKFVSKVFSSFKSLFCDNGLHQKRRSLRRLCSFTKGMSKNHPLFVSFAMNQSIDEPSTFVSRAKKGSAILCIGLPLPYIKE